jgi:hypothetical protein
MMIIGDCSMTIDNEQFIVDAAGNRVSVVLPMADYERLLDELDELEAIRAFDAAQAAADEALPFDQAMAELDRERK